LPKDAQYVVPVTARVRRAEISKVGDLVTLRLTIDA
jgi:hypothetical protein